MRHLQSKKQTAWKKSRTFGDLKGGRMRKVTFITVPLPIGRMSYLHARKSIQRFLFPNNGRRYKKRARTATHRRRRSFDTYMAKKKKSI